MRTAPRRPSGPAAPAARALLLAAAILVAGCDGEDGLAGPGERTGGLDLSRVVAVGDGYVAGAADDALYAGAQRHSVLALFAEAAGAPPPLQPLVRDPGFAIGDPGGRLALVSLLPLGLERRPRGGPVETVPDGPYDNLGVPGALVVESLVAESQATSIFGNPFYDDVLRGRGTFAEQVAEADASLVLLWIGAGDILPWVAAGGDASVAPGLPTPPATFASVYERLLDRIQETTDDVVLFTVPDVTLLPVVRAIPPHVVDPETGEPVTIIVQVPRIDPETGEPILDAEGDTVKVAREVPAPLIGPDGELGAGDLVTLDARHLIAEGIGVPTLTGGTGEPLPDSAVLDPGERAIARDAIAAYNDAIRDLAEDRDLALVDVAAFVESLASEGGLVYDGVRLSTEWLFGQAIGLDGAHFTAKGNGVVANLLIDALDARYGADLPHVPTAPLPGVPLLDLP